MTPTRTLLIGALCALTTGTALAQCGYSVWNNPINPICGSNNGSISYTFVGGTAPYYLTFENGATVTTNGPTYTRTGLGVAFYYAIIHDSGNPTCLFKQGNNLTCTVACDLVNLGNLTNYLFVFTNGSEDANWQGASKGFIGNVAVNGIAASERTSGGVPYAGTIRTNDASLGAWQGIVNQNPGQANGSTNNGALMTGLTNNLNSAFSQINALPATNGYSSRSATSLDLLNTQNNTCETFVINVTSGFNVSTKIRITGDAGDRFILRWDTDVNPANGYQGQVKFQSGGAIVPLGGLKASNFIHVAGDLASSGGGSNPAAPYPQGPRYNDGQGALINGGNNFSGGGFFTGYWLTKGDPATGKTSSFSNAIFVGGWYSSTVKFSMTSGTSGVYVAPPVCVCPAQGSGMAPVETSNTASETLRSGDLDITLYPNPNNGDQLRLNVTGLDATLSTVAMDIHDLAGQRMMTATLPVQDGYLNTVIAFEQELAPGMYLVNLQAGEQRFTERLVIQR